MKDWIIISCYDSGYAYSISINGEIKDRSEIEAIKNMANPYKDIWQIYDNWSYDDIIRKIQEKYHKNILICDDGNIRFYELKGE